MIQNGDGSEVELVVWLDDEQAERLEAFAAATGRSTEDVFLEALRAFLAKHRQERDEDEG